MDGTLAESTGSAGASSGFLLRLVFIGEMGQWHGT
jgi:hypothetical protein